MTDKLPDAVTLPRARYSGWACVWCGRYFGDVLAVSAGRAEGWVGAHDLSVEVYQCPPGFGCGPALPEEEMHHGP